MKASRMAMVALVALFGFAVSASADLCLSLDASSPVSDLVIGGTKATLGVFRVATDGSENVSVTEMSFNVSETTGALGFPATSYELYCGGDLLGTTPGIVEYADFEGLSALVPVNSYSRFTLRANLSEVDGVEVVNGMTVRAKIDSAGAVGATGLSTGLYITSGGQSVFADTMTIVEAKPVFTVAPDSPSGQLVPTSSCLLAKYEVANYGNGDITFSASEADRLVIDIERDQSVYDGLPGDWVLRDSTGTLSRVSVADDAGEVVFGFETNSFVVTPGQTKMLYVYGDTTDMVRAGDAIQLCLADDNAENLAYSIDFGPALAFGNYVFRGDLYAGALVQAVPEPATMSLLGFGLVSVILRRRRRNRS